MLEEDPPDGEDEPTDEPLEPADDDPPDPPPDGRATAVPLLLPVAGRESGRSFAWPANAGATQSENVAAAAHKVTARRVMMCS
jgi:hypothetical protein